MSLTHIGYVCSHIQNASQVRLGLTSIVATKVHVALMLALQKQGFISSVTLGSKKPPATFALQEQQQTPVKEQESSAIQDKPWLAYPQPSEATPSTQRSLKAEYERRWFGSPKLSFVNTLLAREQGTIEQFPPKVLQSYLADRKWLANVRHIWGPTEKSDAALERNSKHLMDSLDLPDSPFFTHMTELHEHEVGELQELAQWGQEQNTKRDAAPSTPSIWRKGYQPHSCPSTRPEPQGPAESTPTAAHSQCAPKPCAASSVDRPEILELRACHQEDVHDQQAHQAHDCHLGRPESYPCRPEPKRDQGHSESGRVHIHLY
ncbi:hypothetical protein EJ05DRAFT_478290 [Pseudovirgaria hyperparasitica]|uniref:Uncharacterized protein n=1 Tax=Pseudovirgaria hyperparasitica TaxID=470096 RepID=A0A6A6W2D0_9PEZI|nr:uncharacterized protein EJ05DRAFT_478290 [Pseudovirgaria hyperparasitica]KAF2756279.1 hypothetical protein EJ05DRAFT_478290 [Pseudovirgaria hyperparasitica]